MESVGADVDLVDAAGNSLADVLLTGAGAAVEDQGHLQGGLQLGQPLKVQSGHIALGILAVGGADGNSQGIDAGTGNVVLGLLHIGIHIGGLSVAVSGLTHMAQLAFHADTLGMGQIHHHAGASDIFLIGQGGSVDHHIGEALVNGHQLRVPGGTVVQVQANGNIRPLRHVDNQGNDVVGMGVLGHLANTHLHDDGGMLLAGGFNNGTSHFHIDTVDSHNGVAVPVGVVQHFFHTY